MKRFILFFFIATFFHYQCNAQGSVGETLMKIKTDFQKFADTTFIIEKKYSGVIKPDYFILSKKGNQVNIYFYGDVTRSIKVPSGIKLAMKDVNFTGDKLRSYNNVLFYPLAITNIDASNFWQKIILSRPWEINDAKKNQYCADPQIKLFDGDQITLHMITKTYVKSASFPSPDFYEEKCPGNPHRKAILGVQDIFKQYFKF